MTIKTFLTTSLFLTLSCAVWADKINDYQLNVGEFTSLKVLDNANVIYRCNPDSAGLAVYRGETEFDDSFIIHNSNGTLKIQVTTDDVTKPNLPVLTIYSTYLTEAKNQGTATVRVYSPAPCPEFKAEQMGNGTLIVEGINSTKVTGKLNTGNGTVVLTGRTQEATYKMVGTGVIQADELQAEEVTIKLMGSGSIGCWATEKLKSSGIGSTKIYYKGNPKIKKSGGGKLLHLETGIEVPETLEERSAEN